MKPHRCQFGRCVMIASGVLLGFAAGARGDAKGPEVTVKTVTEDSLRGRLVALSLREGLLLHHPTDGEQSIPLKDLVRITVGMPASRLGEGEFTLKAVNGDVLCGSIVGSQGDAVVIDTTDLGRVPVPLDSVAGLDAARSSQPAYRGSVQWLDRLPTADEDRLLLTNGDTVTGFVTSIDADGVAIESGLGSAIVPHRRVVAVRLASMRAPILTQPTLILTFRRSGRLTVTDLNWSGSVAEAGLPDGQRVTIEGERIVRVDAVGGRWEWLSQHAPISSEHTAMLSLGWEHVNDRNVLGGRVSVAGESFERGIGVHSRSSLIFDLQGGYREFVTFFGIDDDSGPYADVSVAILVDGKRRFEKTHVRRGTLHGPVRLDISRANRIELIADFGDNGDLQDRLDWVEAALIR